MPEYIGSLTGAKFRTDFCDAAAIQGGVFRPFKGADQFEWQAVREAVEQCGRRFTMIDLGAGYGWWGINAAAALRENHPRKRGLIVMVEAEPTHYRWLETAISVNPYPGITYRPVQAAIGTSRGRDWFYVGNPTQWYGQRLMLDYHRKLLDGNGGELSRDGGALCTADGYRLEPVAVVTLKQLLPWAGAVDLVDMDIQGSEAEFIEKEKDLLTKRVKRLFVSTHSKEIHERVRLALRDDWDLRFAFDPDSEQDSENGKVNLEDGQQFWVRA